MTCSGSCLCGAVTWSVSGALTSLSHCHCQMCRKAHGAPFATFTSCPADQFQWTAGADNVAGYASSAELHRAFCKTCGSAVPGHHASGDSVFLPAGSFDDDAGLRGGEHIFVASKAAWHTIADDLEQHVAYPGQSAGPVSTTRVTDGTGVHGSCLCGQCAFVVTSPFVEVHNCHCTRCRKARGAAHTTNGFVAAEHVVWERGRELVQVYRLPSAKAFSHAFCLVCGSGMPRTDKKEGLIGVPFGSLDDEPNVGPMDHIHLDSRAPWYDPDDNLPRFSQGPD